MFHHTQCVDVSLATGKVDSGECQASTILCKIVLYLGKELGILINYYLSSFINYGRISTFIVLLRPSPVYAFAHSISFRND